MTIEFLTKEDFLELDNKLSRIIELLSTVKASEQKEWLKSAEVKSILNCSDATLKNYRDKGELPYSKIGGTYYYSAINVGKLLENKNLTITKSDLNEI